MIRIILAAITIAIALFVVENDYYMDCGSDTECCAIDPTDDICGDNNGARK